METALFQSGTFRRLIDSHSSNNHHFQERHQMSDIAVKITTKPYGPFRVEAVPSLAETVTLINVDGQTIDLTGKPGISLCRCGASTNKPFCDGTHSKIGFEAAEAAVAAENK
jgi:CDGSH-type Zn-finger protein